MGSSSSAVKFIGFVEYDWLMIRHNRNSVLTFSLMRHCSQVDENRPLIHENLQFQEYTLSLNSFLLSRFPRTSNQHWQRLVFKPMAAAPAILTPSNGSTPLKKTRNVAERIMRLRNAQKQKNRIV